MATESGKSVSTNATVKEENRGRDENLQSGKKNRSASKAPNTEMSMTEFSARHAADLKDSSAALTELFKKEMEQLQKSMAKEIKKLQTEISNCKQALAIPKPSTFVGKREARAVDDFIWEMGQYFNALNIVDDAKKIKTVTLFLKDTATLWWRRKHGEIKTWDDFVKEIKKQYYPENAEDEATIRLRNLRQNGTIKDYVEAFTTLVLEVPDFGPKHSLLYFIHGLQPWAKIELQRRNVRDFSAAIVEAEKLIDHSESIKSNPNPNLTQHEEAM